MKQARSIIHLLMILSVIVFVASCNNDQPNPVSPTLQPSISGMSPASVFLGSQNVDGRITGANLSGSVTVNLGDGIQVLSTESLSANEVKVVFTVQRNASAGPRTITVTATGGTATAPGLLQVSNNTVPVADFKISGGEKHKGSIVTFDASASSDDKKIASFSWDFGDGAAGRGMVIEHKYLRGGSFKVTLTLADNQGGRTTATKGVKVDDNFAPIAKFEVPKQITAGEKALFDGSLSSDRDGTIATYLWKFGDGKQEDGKRVNHIYDSPRQYTVELTVTDNDGAKEQAEKVVTVDRPAGGGGGGGGGGNEGTCQVNDYRSNAARVVAFSGNVVTMSRSFRKCPSCGEFRRRAEGIQEFVGDVTSISGNRYSLRFGSLPSSTRPRVGETLYLVWRTCRR